MGSILHLILLIYNNMMKLRGFLKIKHSLNNNVANLQDEK